MSKHWWARFFHLASPLHSTPNGFASLFPANDSQLLLPINCQPHARVCVVNHTIGWAKPRELGKKKEAELANLGLERAEESRIAAAAE
jgi:hypothetical protein